MSRSFKKEKEIKKNYLQLFKHEKEGGPSLCQKKRISEKLADDKAPGKDQKNERGGSLTREQKNISGRKK